MKKLILTVALVAVAGSAYAAGFVNKTYLGVTGTKHDLAGGFADLGGGLAPSSQQKCIYCHTPHNAEVKVPLWNRAAPATINNLYNSPTLTPVAKAASIGTSSISALCMSCHDGVTAYGNIQRDAQNSANWQMDPTNAGTKMLAGSFANLLNTNGAGVVGGLGGTELTNDHPVGFNYETAANYEFANQGGAYGTGLYDLTTANSKLGGNAFFSPGGAAVGAGTDMECASCHKVHDDRKAPFLRISNDVSQLCLACHVK